MRRKHAFNHTILNLTNMQQKHTRRACYWLLAGCLVLGGLPGHAQQVIFPQQQQAGIARAQRSDHAYTLSNDLLSVRFEVDGGILRFAGCPAMNLEPGTDLFKLVLGDGTVLTSSQMTLSSVDLHELEADPKAAKGSLRLPGKAIEAYFTHGSLAVRWRAVLRDGSHYLRTELTLSSNVDQPMTSITPMLYEVNTAAAGSAPVVVGNTRGAILASDKIFAGLETPMGINTVENSRIGAGFDPAAWTAESFDWAPGDQTPREILALGLTPADVRAARGYATFAVQGRNVLTFAYKEGAHQLNVVGVDALDPVTGRVLASDYHAGHTGNSHQANSYTLDLPRTGAVLLRYFVETRSESIASSGTVTCSHLLKRPVVLYDLIGGNGQAATHPIQRPEVAVCFDNRNPLVAEGDTCVLGWYGNKKAWQKSKAVPSRINELGYYSPDVYCFSAPVNVRDKQSLLSATYQIEDGYPALHTLGIDLVDRDGNVVTYDYRAGQAAAVGEPEQYSIRVPYAGSFTLRFFAETRSGKLPKGGSVALTAAVADTLHLPAAATTPIQGRWNRSTTLKAGREWNVSSVVGLMAPGQARRSVLAYSERERAVPWRAYPVYISWYELNIDRNNATAPSYDGNMTVSQCTDVVKHWRTDFYDRYKVAPQAFVWDDGWDEYGTWKFNRNFPNGFKEPAREAARMGAGIGAWLGPVGGYGKSGDYRRQYWRDKGSSMELSNQAYYDFFVDACRYMVKTYDFRFFKYDGISAQFSAVGPDPGTRGEENAEAIISIERDLRATKPDLFLNTTVGTWASPFWFQFTDAVWRQEQDYGEIGNQGSDRERWITYRDRLVYQNFVQRSPLCPINTLMTHGFILSRHGQVSKDMSYDAVVREMRCAFACGSGMVELYCDYELMNSIPDNQGRKGQLWKELAGCMAWQKKQADVLPDVHWVGGNPWDGLKANVYGWAAWNARKAVLTLRNPAASAQTFVTTLRQALDIPAYVHTTVTLTDGFAQQQLEGLPLGQPIDIDTPLTLKLAPSQVYIYDGTDNGGSH